jgi:tetraacyldisaccharide 4'-kinase
VNDALRTLLTPVSWLYGAVVAARNRHYDRPANRVRAGIPVVSVGNLTVGGTGKTPIVCWIAERLRDDGRRPAVVSRGYGGTAGRGPCVVSRGEGPRVDVRVAGDEPYFMAHTLPGVRVIVGSHRAGGVEAAVATGADIAILDDGFQHRRLARDLDLLLVDRSDPFGGGRLLPAGRLREPLSGMSRADLVLLTRSCSAELRVELETTLRRHLTGAPVLEAGHECVGFVDAEGEATEVGPRVVAFCGIGHPAGFRRDLEARGLELVDFVVFRDHHDYSSAELHALSARASASGAGLVTTEKDLARLSGVPTAVPGPIAALRIRATIDRPGPLLERLGALK